jgi:hypothetical protein
VSWEDLNVKPPEKDTAAESLQRDTALALNKAPLLKKYLNAVVKGGTYAHGRSLDNVAFSEGQRALARTLLQLGGQFDE